jgi:uncharacterized protein (TIGR02453 family)
MANMRDTYNFLRAVALNNNREWFNAHKDEYLSARKQWETDIERLIGLMAEDNEDMRGLRVNDCAYRIYRDVRFSPNKNPYKTYFSAVLGKRGRKGVQASCYLHMEPGNSGLHAGIWCPDSSILSKLRSEIDANIEEFKEILADPDFASHFSFYGDKLKSLPRGFSKDNPNAEYIKMKEYLCIKKVEDAYFFNENWVEKVAEDFSRTKKFNTFLNYIFDEE